ncbi:hypothetical protein B0J14DRAFT_676199, partial [Halenospora varia]
VSAAQNGTLLNNQATHPEIFPPAPSASEEFQSPDESETGSSKQTPTPNSTTKPTSRKNAKRQPHLKHLQIPIHPLPIPSPYHPIVIRVRDGNGVGTLLLIFWLRLLLWCTRTCSLARESGASFTTNTGTSNSLLLALTRRDRKSRSGGEGVGLARGKMVGVVWWWWWWWWWWLEMCQASSSYLLPNPIHLVLVKSSDSQSFPVHTNISHQEPLRGSKPSSTLPRDSISTQTNPILGGFYEHKRRSTVEKEWLVWLVDHHSEARRGRSRAEWAGRGTRLVGRDGVEGEVRWLDRVWLRRRRGGLSEGIVRGRHGDVL